MIKITPKLTVAEAAAIARRSVHCERVYLGRSPDGFADLYSYAGAVVAVFGAQRKSA